MSYTIQHTNQEISDSIDAGLELFEAGEDATSGQIIKWDGTKWANAYSDTFLCTYGTTTSAEIATAITNNQLPICFYNGIAYTFYGTASSRYVFSSLGSTASNILLCKISDSTWSNSSATFEKTSNKIISISSSSTNTEYPSALATYNAINAIKSVQYNGELTVAGWSNNAQTLTISGLDTSGCSYVLSPTSASLDNYKAAEIYADDITTANQITFHCATTPTSAINVVILKVKI